MENKNFNGETIKNKEIDGGTISKCKFLLSLLSSCKFINCSFDDVSFKVAFLHQCEFIDCTFKDVSFNGARFGTSKFYNCSFINTVFNDAYMDKVDIINCKFQCCSGINGDSERFCKGRSVIGWKMGYYLNNDGILENVIIRLEIPEDALKSSATTNSCRCDKAKVLDITTIKGCTHVQEARSILDANFIYKVGEIVEVSNFDNRYWIESTHGIHFFLHELAARNYLDFKI